jgi:hypothetical protein
MLNELCLLAAMSAMTMVGTVLGLREEPASKADLHALAAQLVAGMFGAVPADEYVARGSRNGAGPSA